MWTHYQPKWLVSVSGEIDENKLLVFAFIIDENDQVDSFYNSQKLVSGDSSLCLY